MPKLSASVDASLSTPDRYLEIFPTWRETDKLLHPAITIFALTAYRLPCLLRHAPRGPAAGARAGGWGQAAAWAWLLQLVLMLLLLLRHAGSTRRKGEQVGSEGHPTPGH